RIARSNQSQAITGQEPLIADFVHETTDEMNAHAAVGAFFHGPGRVKGGSGGGIEGLAVVLDLNADSRPLQVEPNINAPASGADPVLDQVANDLLQGELNLEDDLRGYSALGKKMLDLRGQFDQGAGVPRQGLLQRCRRHHEAKPRILSASSILWVI